MKTIALFADVSNLYFCVNRKFDKRKLDYKSYLAKAVGNDNLYRAFAYGTFLSDETIKFVTCLQHLGYETRFRDPRIHTKSDGRKENWAVDWNVGISMDVVRLIKKLDTIIIGSSMIDLIPLIEWIKEQGVKVIIMSCGIPAKMKHVADKWIELDESYLESKDATPETTK